MIDYPKLQQWALKRAGGDRTAATELIIDMVESAAVNGDTVAIHTRHLACAAGSEPISPTTADRRTAG